MERSIFDEAVPTREQLTGEGPGEATPAGGVDIMLKGAEEVLLPETAGRGETGTEGAAQGGKKLEDARQENARLEAEIKALQQKITEGQDLGDESETGEPEESTKGEFKVLSDKDYETLVEEDPVEALKYQNRLRNHEKAQAETKTAVDKERSQAMMVAARMNQEVPGLYMENSPVAKALVEHCELHGVDRQVLGLLTDPTTKIIVDGKAVPLGDGARQLTVMIAAGYEAATGQRVRASSKKVGAASRGKDSAARDRKDKDYGGFPTTDPEIEFAKMSPDEQRKYLGG